MEELPEGHSISYHIFCKIISARMMRAEIILQKRCFTFAGMLKKITTCNPPRKYRFVQ